MAAIHRDRRRNVWAQGGYDKNRIASPSEMEPEEGSELWQVPLGLSSFVWGDQGGCEEAPGMVQEGDEGRQEPVRLEGQGPGSAWQVGPKAFPEGGRGRETEGLWEDFRI